MSVNYDAIHQTHRRQLSHHGFVVYPRRQPIVQTCPQSKASIIAISVLSRAPEHPVKSAEPGQQGIHDLGLSPVFSLDLKFSARQRLSRRCFFQWILGNCGLPRFLVTSYDGNIPTMDTLLCPRREGNSHKRYLLQRSIWSNLKRTRRSSQTNA